LKSISIFGIIAVCSVIVTSAFVFGTANIGFEIVETDKVELSDNAIFTVSAEQKRIDADLEARGFTLIDGKWWDEESLKIKEFIALEGINIPLQIGGWLTVEHYDSDRNLISKQIIHNRVVDEGEDFIIDQTFKEGTAGETADADQLATICVSAEVGFVDTSETKTAVSFDSADALTSTNCISDTSVTQSAQTAVIGAETFDAPTHVPNDTTITGIGICQGAAATPFNQCQDAQAGSTGIMLSQINIGDVTLAASETVDITYTLDLSSASS